RRMARPDPAALPRQERASCDRARATGARDEAERGRGPRMTQALELPSYREQSPEVADRFRRLREPPVVLQVKDLVKTFETAGRPVTALEGVSFEAFRREFLCVIGPSGCGKSTLARILAGLDDYTSGEVLLDGAPIHGPGCERGMVFQGYTLFPWLTVL